MVELVVALHPRRQVALGALQPRQALFNPVHDPGVEERNGQGDGQPFQDAAHLEEFQDGVRAEGGHHRPAVRPVDDEAFAVETLDRLTDRHAADLKLPRDGFLVQARASAQLSAQDAAAEVGVDVLLRRLELATRPGGRRPRVHGLLCSDQPVGHWIHDPVSLAWPGSHGHEPPSSAFPSCVPVKKSIRLSRPNVPHHPPPPIR